MKYHRLTDPLVIWKLMLENKRLFLASKAKILDTSNPDKEALELFDYYDDTMSLWKGVLESQERYSNAFWGTHVYYEGILTIQDEV